MTPATVAAAQPVVILCQPLYGHIPPTAHGHQMEFMGANVARGLTHGYRARAMAYIDDARNGLIKTVIDGWDSATHILFVDQDMLVPHGGDGKSPNAVALMLAAGKEVVSGVYHFKNGEAALVAWETLGMPETGVRSSEWKKTPRLLEDFDPTGLQPVAGTGMGCCLIQVSFLKAMRDHFKDEEWFRSERGGEDYHFCRRVAVMGRQVWMDGRIQCQHIGDAAFTYREWKAGKGEGLTEKHRT